MLGKSLYIFGAKLVGYGLRLLLPMVLARLLVQADFGAYRQFFLLELMISLLFQFGINQSLYYFIPRDEKNAGAYLLNSVVLNVIIYGVVYTIIGFFRADIAVRLKMPVLNDHFFELAAYTLFIMMAVAGDCYLVAQRKIKQSAAFEILGQSLACVASVTAAFLTRSLEAIILALVLSRLLHVSIMLAYIQFGMRGFGAARYFTHVRAQIKYGVVLGLGGTFWMLLSRTHEMIVSSRYGPELYAVYSVGCTHMQIMNYYMYSLIVVSLGRFAQLEKAGDDEGTRMLWRDVLTSLYGIIVPVVVVLMIVSKPLLILMFTEKYLDALPIFRLNLLTSFSMLWNAALVLRAMNRNDVTLWLHLSLLIAAPFLLYGAMNLYGMVGVMASQVLLLVSGRLLALGILNRISGMRLAYAVTPAECVVFYRRSLKAVQIRLGYWLRKVRPA
jgi:O-antigen/teichoic acid export membrane protein